MESTAKADVWRERITSQRASGQAVRAWCRDNHQREHMFYWWRSRLGLSPKSMAKTPVRRTRRMGFAEVVVDRVACRPCRNSRDAILVLPASMPVESIAKLVRALEASS
jgi:hypothetical protein